MIMLHHDPVYSGDSKDVSLKIRPYFYHYYYNDQPLSLTYREGTKWGPFWLFPNHDIKQDGSNTEIKLTVQEDGFKVSF
jgi:hypothetical protein